MSVATMPKVFLVGVDHRIQYTNAACGPEWTAEIRAFEDYLISEVAKRSVDLVAEEFNEELLAQNSATACTVRDAASRGHCPHMFCEPNNAERTVLNLSTNERREEVWLQRLVETDARRILFVCGDDHLTTFAQRLKASGFSVTELARGRGSDWWSMQ
jgi:hypothetical protein